MKLIIVIHDVSSTNRLSETVRVIQSFKDKVEAVILTRVTGAAAQYGLAEASKTLYKNNISTIILPDLKDLEELFNIENALQITNSYGERSYEPDMIKDRAIIILSGSDTGFSKTELLEKTLKTKIPGTEQELPPEAVLGIIFYSLRNKK